MTQISKERAIEILKEYLKSNKPPSIDHQITIKHDDGRIECHTFGYLLCRSGIE